MNVQSDAIFLLDSSMFIEAYRRYYGLDICPGFWDFLIHHGAGGRVTSIDWVRRELSAGRGPLAAWANSQGADLFVSTRELLVIEEYERIMKWVFENRQFLDHAKAEFASGADGWLVAYGRVYGMTLVTQESYNPNIRKRVPLPNVCRTFGVATANTFKMLRDLGAAFDWMPP